VNREPRLRARVSPVAQLEDALVEKMYRLFVHYYGGSSRSMFIEDLQGKDYCLLLENDHSRLCGFTTLAVSEHQVEGRRLRSLFSGDTIIHHEYWGSQVLPRAWCRLAGRIKSQAPDLPLYWFLIVKGHRTYRYLKLFSREYHPAPDRPVPATLRALMDFLARERFGECYDAESGVIRFTRSRNCMGSCLKTTGNFMRFGKS